MGPTLVRDQWLHYFENASVQVGRPHYLLIGGSHLPGPCTRIRSTRVLAEVQVVVTPVLKWVRSAAGDLLK